MLANKTKQSAMQRSVSMKQSPVPYGGIGTKNESSLHRSLKIHCSGSEGSIETTVGNYVCDGLTSGGEIIEVQTGSFGPLKEKLNYLVQTGKVRVIYPIVTQKEIELFDSYGSLLHKRKSPRRGSAWDLFKALIYAPELGSLKNLTIELAFIDILEKRVDDGKGSWRRKGVSITDRFLGAWHNSIVLSKRKDYLQFIPFKKSECFTARLLAKKAKINVSIARKTLYVLVKMGLLEKTGTQGKALTYRLKQ